MYNTTRFGRFHQNIHNAYEMLAKGAKSFQYKGYTDSEWLYKGKHTPFVVGTNYRVEPEVFEFEDYTVTITSKKKAFHLALGAGELIEQLIKDNDLILEEKPHKHHDVIMQWLSDTEGKYDLYCKPPFDEDKWALQQYLPIWDVANSYELREKPVSPRVFKEYGWYPVITKQEKSGICQCVKYPSDCGGVANHFACDTFSIEEEDCLWIGEEIHVNWAS